MIKPTVEIRERLKASGYKLFGLHECVDADVPVIIDNFIIFSCGKTDVEEFFDHVIALSYTQSAATDINRFIAVDCKKTMSELSCLDAYPDFKSYVNKTVSQVIRTVKQDNRRKNISNLINNIYNLRESA